MENKNDINYWIERCKAAEEFIYHAACDPDEGDGQWARYIKWQSIALNEEGVTEEKNKE